MTSSDFDEESQQKDTKSLTSETTGKSDAPMTTSALSNFGSPKDSGLSLPTYGDIIPPGPDILPNVFAGLIAGVKLTLGMIVFAVIIFKTPGDRTLEAATASGINVMLFGGAISLIINAMFSRMPFSLCTPQDTSSILIAAMATEIVNNVDNPDEIVPTLLWSQCLNAALISLACYIAHRYELSKLILLLPYSVLCAFLGSIGYSGIRGSMSLMSGVTFNHIWPSDFDKFFSASCMAQVACGVSFFLGMLNLRRFVAAVKDYTPTWMTPLWLISYIIFTPLLFWLVVGIAGYDSTYLREMGWLFMNGDEALFYNQWDSYNVSNVNFKALVGLLPDCVSMVFLIWVSSLLNITGIEATAFPTGINKDGELLNLALCNGICAAVGGAPVFHQMGITLSVLKDGGSHRLAPLVSAGFLLLVWLTGTPYELQKVVPRFYLGAIFLSIGWSFFSTWVLKSRKNMHHYEYGVVLCVVFFADFKQNTLVSLLISVMLACCIFIVQSSKGGTVKSQYSARSKRSASARNILEERVLDNEGSRILVLRLTGALFFGSVQKLALKIRKFIGMNSDRAEYIILDFAETLNIDASSAENLKKIYLEVLASGGCMLFVNLTEEQTLSMTRIGVKPIDAVIVSKIIPAAPVSKLPPGRQTEVERYSDIGFDKSVVGLFGNGVAGRNTYPFFDDVGRAMELCEDDLLMRFMHGPKDKSGNVIDGGVSIATAPTDSTISSAEASHLRKAQYNLTDEEFFNLEEMQGLPSEIKDYATVVTAPKGKRIFQASQNHNCFYLIRQGVVEVRTKRPPGSRAAGERWGSKGATHMEMINSFITQTVEPLDHVSVSSNTRLWVFERDAIIRMDIENPKLSSLLFKEITVQQARARFIATGVRSRDEESDYTGYQYLQLHTIEKKQE